MTEEYQSFIDKQEKKLVQKFFQLIEIIRELKVLNSNFIKKLQSAKFYELRIKAGNEYRILIFEIDHLNFSECKKAINQSEKILKEYPNKTSL